MCWRVALSTAFVGILGALLLGALELADTARATTFLGPAAIFFGLFPAPLFGVLASLFGPWLKRFFLFSQGLLFGLIGAAGCVVALLIIDAVNSILHPCPPDMGCFAPLTGALAVSLYAGVPFAIMAGVGYGIAIRVSNSRRAARIFVILLAVAVPAFVAAIILAPLRPVPAPTIEEPPPPVCEVSVDGRLVEVPCGQQR